MRFALVFLFFGVIVSSTSAHPTEVKEFYNSSLVKKLGIKIPPRNRLKTDLSRPAAERELAVFLNKQLASHQEHVVTILELSGYIKPKFISECVAKLNDVARSTAWKKLAVSNIHYVFYGDVKKYKDDIYSGLNRVDNMLIDLKYAANEKSNRLLLSPSRNTRTCRHDFKSNFHILNCPECQADGKVAVATDDMFKLMEKIRKGKTPPLSKKQRNANRRMRILLDEHSAQDNTLFDQNDNAFDIGIHPYFDQ